MPKKKYLVDLSTEERESLCQLVRRGKHSSRKVTRTRILLLASDASTDEQIVAAPLTKRRDRAADSSIEVTTTANSTLRSTGLKGECAGDGSQRRMGTV